MIDTNEIRERFIGGWVLWQQDISNILALCDEIDRLRAGGQKPQGKTVRVKFKAFVTSLGDVSIPQFNMMGRSGKSVQFCGGVNGRCVAITADLPIPEETTVEAEVHSVTTDGNATGGRG